MQRSRVRGCGISCVRAIIQVCRPLSVCSVRAFASSCLSSLCVKDATAAHAALRCLLATTQGCWRPQQQCCRQCKPFSRPDAHGNESHDQTPCFAPYVRFARLFFHTALRVLCLSRHSSYFRPLALSRARACVRLWGACDQTQCSVGSRRAPSLNTWLLCGVRCALAHFAGVAGSSPRSPLRIISDRKPAPYGIPYPCTHRPFLCYRSFFPSQTLRVLVSGTARGVFDR